MASLGELRDALFASLDSKGALDQIRGKTFTTIRFSSSTLSISSELWISLSFLFSCIVFYFSLTIFLFVCFLLF
jgi:hypothetical protein